MNHVPAGRPVPRGVPAHIILHSGGSVKGAVPVRSLLRVLAMIRKLKEDPVALPDSLIGTSVGASNLALVAMDMEDELIPTWRAIDDPNPWNGIRGVAHPTPLGNDGGGFFTLDHPKGLAGQMERFGTSCSKLRTRFGVGIYLPERDLHIVPEWDHRGPLGGHTIDLRKGILASSAIMPVFAGVEIQWEGESHNAADGGHEHIKPPVPAWVEAGDFVWDLYCYPVEPGIIRRSSKKTDGRFERALLATDKATHAPIIGDFKATRLLEDHGVHVACFAPRKDPGGMLDASGATILWRLDDLGKDTADHPVFVSSGHPCFQENS